MRGSRGSQILDPVRSLFVKGTFRPDAIQELIGQLKAAAAASNAANSLEQIAENPKPPGKRPMESRGMHECTLSCLKNFKILIFLFIFIINVEQILRPEHRSPDF